MDENAPRFRSRRWNQYFDGMAAIAMTVASAAVVWTLFARGSTASVPPTPRPADTRVPEEPVAVTGAAIKGRRDAPIGIIEYSEFQCPYCASFVRDTLPSIARAYLDTGKAFLAFQHLPLEGIHPLALDAAISAECAKRQGRFWQMHDSLFAIQKDLRPASFVQQASAVGLTKSEYESCVNDTRTADQIRSASSNARAMGVSATPTFFIGRVLPDGRVKVMRRLVGAQPFTAFEEVLKLIDESP